MLPRNIQVHAYPSASPATKPALLFVHGGYVDSTCWEINFIPFFCCAGYDCFAVDLSGHGESDGRERIDDFGIDDYADDVAIALRTIGRPAILVGHSMGALVVQRFLERGEVLAAIFIAPVPVTGTGSSAIQLAWRYPSFFEALDDILDGHLSPKAVEIMTHVYFSPDTSPEDALRFMPSLGPESQRVITEMALLHARPSRSRRRLPALVVGGTQDAIFSPSMLGFSALSWDADVYRVDGAGHMVMLDPQWEDAASHILAWLNGAAAAG